MLISNPYSALTTFLSPGFIQGYVILMVIAVIVGTILDLTLNENKIEFFLSERRRAKSLAKRRLGVADIAGVTTRAVFHDIVTFGEFCNRARRISHALMAYGFLLYLITTVVMIFAYPTGAVTPIILPVLWNIGVLATLVGGYWFFLFLRVNVVHDGHPPWRLQRADLFIVTLLASVSLALLLEIVEPIGSTALSATFATLYLIFSTLLFATVPWSKFAHMFYKPVVAFQRRREEADGSSPLPAHTTTGTERCPPSHT